MAAMRMHGNVGNLANCSACRECVFSCPSTCGPNFSFAGISYNSEVERFHGNAIISSLCSHMIKFTFLFACLTSILSSLYSFKVSLYVFAVTYQPLSTSISRVYWIVVGGNCHYMCSLVGFAGGHYQY